MNEYGNYVLNAFPQPYKFDEFLQSKVAGIEFVRRGESIVTNRHILGRDIEIKKLRSNTNLGSFEKTFYVIIVLCDENRIEEQTLEVLRHFVKEEPDTYKERFSIKMLNLKVLKNNQVIKVKSIYDYATGGTKYTQGTKHVGNPLSIYPASIYRYNDVSVLEKSEMKYTRVWEIKDGFDIAKAYKYKTMLEMLYKNGLRNLWRDVARGNADMRRLTKKQLIKNRQMLRELNPDYRQYQWIPSMVEFGFKATPKLVDMIDTWTDYELKYRIEIADKFNLKAKDLMMYLHKQDCSAVLYRDYRNMLDKLNTPASTNQTIYPKDLKAAHDDAVMKFNTIKHEASNKAYRRRLKGLSKYEYQSTKYSIIVPKRLEDVLEEGKILNHCVGSYVEGVSEGKTTILFLRKTEEIEKPFYTVEYKDNAVRQCRGENNSKRTEEIEDFLDEWKKYIKKSKKKSEKQEVAYARF